MLIWIFFFLFWYVDLVPKVCPHFSVTLYILSIYGFLGQEKNPIRMLRIAACIHHNCLLDARTQASWTFARRPETPYIPSYALDSLFTREADNRINGSTVWSIKYLLPAKYPGNVPHDCKACGRFNENIIGFPHNKMFIISQSHV
jgi:hypothetical protein